MFIVTLLCIPTDENFVISYSSKAFEFLSRMKSCTSLSNEDFKLGNGREHGCLIVCISVPTQLLVGIL